MRKFVCYVHASRIERGEFNRVGQQVRGTAHYRLPQIESPGRVGGRSDPS